MQKNEILATVDGRNITRSDADYLLRTMNPQTAAQFKTEEGFKNLVTELANQELFYLDALENGLDKDDAYIAEVERAKANILKQLSLNRLLGGISASDNEVIEYYENNKNDFANSPSVKASHILVDDASKAEEILNEINNGRSFDDAAQEYSTCPSSAQGGDLGFFSSGMMVPEFEEAAFNLKAGELAGPVETQFGFHLIKVFERQEGTIKPFSEVSDEIRKYLTTQKQNKVYFDKLKTLKSQHQVTLNI